MVGSEFDIIVRYFSPQVQHPSVQLAGGDDCALLVPPDNAVLAMTTDTLVSGRHFPHNTSASDIACKSVAVNLSDLAAMGATPLWVTLALSLPEINEQWLADFSSDFLSALAKSNVMLIGGDMTQGPLSITVQATGYCQKGWQMLRSAARPGDRIYVTGNLGDAAIGLHCLQNDIRDKRLQTAIDRLNRPQARVTFAQDLVNISRCAIDISDGLLADLGHILKASGCGATVYLDRLPLSDVAEYYFAHYQRGQVDWSMIAAHGDDYELCFTVAEKEVATLQQLAERHRIRLTCVGEIKADAGLVCLDEKQQPVVITQAGYQHF